MAKDLRNVSASVLAQLLARAKGAGEDYSSLLNAFVCERFLHRLDRSEARGRFVLKGAMLLRLWSEQPYRATRDLDLLCKGDGSRYSEPCSAISSFRAAPDLLQRRLDPTAS
jgi:hypothetical protein